MPIANESFWEDLLDFIDDGKVIPVTGQGITTIGPDDALLLPWLSQKLAEKLKIASSVLPPQPTLHDVVVRHLVYGGDLEVPYKELSRILRDQCPSPGETLRRLAAIPRFRLFLSTTPDPLLARALNEVRFGGAAAVKVGAYSPEAEMKDVPARHSALTGATVFHLMGRVSQVTDYVLWDEDTLEFLCRLNEHIPVVPNLAKDLKDPTLRLLVLGLDFADWVVRFLLRVMRQGRLSQERIKFGFLADGQPDVLPSSLVMFFGAAKNTVEVIPCDPRSFVTELSQRWLARHPDGSLPAADSEALPAADMPLGAVFISYAREDETAVKRLKAGLDAAGCLVWYDRERLQTGMNFHYQLEDAVKTKFSLFLSVISRTTESESEAYYIVSIKY